MTGRAPFTDALFASEDLSWSPPKAFGGETQGAGGSPDRREQVLSCEGEDPSCSPLWRGETQGAGGSPDRREQVLSLGGRDREGLAGAVGHPLERDREGLATPRFTHRLTDPRFAAQHRAPAVRTPQSLVSPLNPSGKPELQKSQNRRGLMIRDPFVAGQKGGVLGLSRKDALRNEPPGRSGRPTVGRYGGGRYGERFPIYVNRTRDQFATAIGVSTPSRTERPCL